MCKTLTKKITSFLLLFCLGGIITGCVTPHGRIGSKMRKKLLYLQQGLFAV